MSKGSSKGNLAELGEQLKQVLEGVQDKYESFIDDAQLYKKGKIDDVNFFYKLSEYLLDLTKVNFLEARFVLELKSILESKGGKRQVETHQMSVSDRIPVPSISNEDRSESPLKRTCNNCGAEINSTAKFCRSCGKSQV
jgi:zinc ribbon protein